MIKRVERNEVQKWVLFQVIGQKPYFYSNIEEFWSLVILFCQFQNKRQLVFVKSQEFLISKIGQFITFWKSNFCMSKDWSLKVFFEMAFTRPFSCQKVMLESFESFRSSAFHIYEKMISKYVEGKALGCVILLKVLKSCSTEKLEVRGQKSI